MTKKKILLTFLCLATLLLAGCASSSVTTPPTPAPITVADALRLLADSNDGAFNAAQAARDAGTCSETDFKIIKTAVGQVANAGLQMNAVLRSTDPWPVQQQHLLAILQTSGLASLQSGLTPNAYALVSVIVNSASQLAEVIRSQP